MKLQSITGDFDFYVDPMYYGFQWTEAMYITVQYSAIKEGDSVVASANNITAAPWLLGSINMRGNWMAVDKQITTATQAHAEKEFNRNGQVNETIMEALTPFI